MFYKSKLKLSAYVFEPKLGDVLLKISGVTKMFGVPVSAPVFLVKGSKILLSTQSDVAGNYEFSNLIKGQAYTVFAKDSNGKFNAVIQDNVVPK